MEFVEFHVGWNHPEQSFTKVFDDVNLALPDNFFNPLFNDVSVVENNGNANINHGKTVIDTTNVDNLIPGDTTFDLNNNSTDFGNMSTSNGNTVIDTTNTSNLGLDNNNAPLSMPPTAILMPTQQDFSGHEQRFRDPKLVQSATLIHQGLTSNTSNHLTGPLQDGINKLVGAMKDRMHHKGLVNRFAKFLDSFPTDAADNTTIPTDQAVFQLANRWTAVIQDKKRAQQAMTIQKDEIDHLRPENDRLRSENDRLRRERDQYQSKAAPAEQLKGYYEHLARESKRAHYEIDRRDKIIETLKSSIATLSALWNEAAPKQMSAHELIMRHAGLHPQSLPFPGVSVGHQSAGFLTPHSAPIPSHAQLPDQVHHHQRFTPNTQSVGIAQRNTVATPSAPKVSPPSVLTTPPRQTAQTMPKVSIDLTSEDTNSSLNHPAQTSSSPAAAYHTPNSSFSSTDTEGNLMSSPSTGNQRPQQQRINWIQNHNFRALPHWVQPPQPYQQHPVIQTWMKTPTIIQQQAGQKRGPEYHSPVGTDAGAARPAKKVKPTEAEKAPKKTAAKKSAPKTIEPKQKAPRKSKKEKEQANQWTPGMARLQRQLLGQPEPLPEAPKTVEEPIIIQDEAGDEESDDQVLMDLFDAYTNQETAEEAAKAAGDAQAKEMGE
ncbi:MAG: hypothetical protein Q9166_006077 [cf. Caloplaca sp. 2 TL-2023]